MRGCDARLLLLQVSVRNNLLRARRSARSWLYCVADACGSERRRPPPLIQGLLSIYLPQFRLALFVRRRLPRRVSSIITACEA